MKIFRKDRYGEHLDLKVRNNFLIGIRLPNITAMKEIRKRRGHLACFAQIRKAFTILIRKPEKRNYSI